MADPRGIRNNNPTNIRHSARFEWDGELEPDSDGFCRFTSMALGVRAAAKNLTTKIKRGENTIRALITAWAPADENDTESYIEAVCNSTGITSNWPLTAKPETLCALIKAIIRHENGGNFVSPETIAEGVALALI